MEPCVIRDSYVDCLKRSDRCPPEPREPPVRDDRIRAFPGFSGPSSSHEGRSHVPHTIAESSRYVLEPASLTTGRHDPRPTEVPALDRRPGASVFDERRDG